MNRLHKFPGVVVEEMGEEILLYRPTTHKAIHLNGTAAAIWKLCDGTRTVKDLVACLEAALWAFARSETFRDAVLLAANLGDDADTTAAVCGQVAGAYYGETGIPSSWLDRLAMRGFMGRLTKRGLAKRSVARALAGVRALYRFLASNDAVDANPARADTSRRISSNIRFELP